MKFRKKPVEAVKWDGSAGTANDFIGESYGTDWKYAPGYEDDALIIPAIDGDVHVNIGDWIVKDAGEFKVMEDGTFKEAYEVVAPYEQA